MREPNDPTPTAKTEAQELARRLLRECRQAALTTAMRNDSGRPYPSFVLTAWDGESSPLLFISELAEHTRNLAVDPRAGLLLVGPDNPDEPAAVVRMSLLGRMEKADAPAGRARFVAAHPGAAKLTALSDFAVWRMIVERAHLIAGFGAARWIDGRALTDPAK